MAYEQFETYEEIFKDLLERVKEVQDDIIRDPDLVNEEQVDQATGALELALDATRYAGAQIAGQEDGIREKRVVLNRYLAAAPREEWHCPLCQGVMPDANKVGHLMSSHEASRELKRPWKVNDDTENLARLQDMVTQLYTFFTRQETRPEATYDYVRLLVSRSADWLREAVKTYKEK